MHLEPQLGMSAAQIEATLDDALLEVDGRQLRVASIKSDEASPAPPSPTGSSDGGKVGRRHISYCGVAY